MKEAVLSIMIVDDEPLARTRLNNLLSDIAEMVPNRVAAEAASGLQALEIFKALQQGEIDVALVDIRMPKMGGIELARHLAQLDCPPVVIFVTAYDNYAVQAFELNAVDYLLKPARAQRLVDALQKLKGTSATLLSPKKLEKLQEGSRTYLSCNERGRLLLIPFDDILYFKADLKYVVARTVLREYLLDESLSRLEEEFPGRFIRLHRSVLVAPDAIAGFEKNTEAESDFKWQALLRDVPEKLPISRRQWPLVKSRARIL